MERFEAHGLAGAKADCSRFCEIHTMDTQMRNKQLYNEAVVDAQIQTWKEKLYLVLDTLTSDNEKALKDAPNQEFIDLFNIPEHNIYRMPSQVLQITSFMF